MLALCYIISSLEITKIEIKGK